MQVAESIFTLLAPFCIQSFNILYRPYRLSKLLFKPCKRILLLLKIFAEIFFIWGTYIQEKPVSKVCAVFIICFVYTHTWFFSLKVIAKRRKRFSYKVKCFIARRPRCFRKKFQYITVHFKFTPRTTAMYILPILA